MKNKEEKIEDTKENIELKTEKVKEELTEKKENSTVKVKNKKMIIYFLIVAIAIIAILIFSTIFALINVNNTKIISGISIKNIDISGLSKEEAKELLTETFENNFERKILVKYNDEYEISIIAKQIEANYNIEEAVSKAYNISRDGNIFSNNYKILFTTIFKNNIDIELNYNEELLNKLIEDISAKIPGAMVDNGYYIEGENLIIQKGTSGLTIERDKLKQDIISELDFGKENDKIINIQVKQSQPGNIDIEKIYKEIYKESKDAYYTTNPFTIYPHIDGIDFTITMDEAKEILSQDKTEWSIPLKITSPQITTNKIGTEAFPDLLSAYSTKFDESNVNRSTNIKLATQKINGTVLLPGETFSYNKVVGKRTAAAGYKTAGVYVGGRVVDGIGGGICQVSTTLYNSAILANLEIIDRSNHMFLTGYVPAGRDATVNYGTIDFQFKNNRKYPIKLVCSAKSGISKFEIFGIREETEYEVIIESKIVGSIPYTTKYIENSNLTIGTEKLEQSGANGCISEAYKILKLNGAVISRTLISRDTYSAKQKIVIKGTKGIETPQSSTPEETNTLTQNTTVENSIPTQQNVQIDEGT